MHVLINRTAAMPGTSGHVHLIETLAAFDRIGAGARFTVLLSRRQQAIADELPPHVGVEMLDLPGNGIVRSLALQRDIPQFVRRAGVDVLFNPGNFFVARPGCRQVCFVENANVFSHPAIAWRPADRRRNAILRQVTRLALRYADHVVIPSHDAAAQFAARVRIRPPITVVHHGWRAEPADPVSPGAETAGRSILCVSSVLPHKNLVRMIGGFRRFIDASGWPGDLVIVGYGADDAYRPPVDAAIAEANLRERVQLLPPVSSRRLAAMYRRAAAAVNPSLEETFGISAIEAMGYGCPQALADTSRSGRGRFFNPFRELCGDTAVYFDPFDEDGMAAAIGAALDESSSAPRVGAGVARAAGFSWDNTAAGLTRAFEQARG